MKNIFFLLLFSISLVSVAQTNFTGFEPFRLVIDDSIVQYNVTMETVGIICL
jgi:hypothetical protein